MYSGGEGGWCSAQGESWDACSWSYSAWMKSPFLCVLPSLTILHALGESRWRPKCFLSQLSTSMSLTCVWAQCLSLTQPCVLLPFREQASSWKIFLSFPRGFCLSNDMKMNNLKTLSRSYSLKPHLSLGLMQKIWGLRVVFGVLSLGTKGKWRPNSYPYSKSPDPASHRLAIQVYSDTCSLLVRPSTLLVTPTIKMPVWQHNAKSDLTQSSFMAYSFFKICLFWWFLHS